MFTRNRVQAACLEITREHLSLADPQAVVVSVEDNLGKGAAGQAMQNANLALGLSETDGLRLYGVKV
jgi:N-acetyl-gamma-glutamyl-phosphate reductase